jgi:O-antigen/teichoic acid export membrane protein
VRGHRDEVLTSTATIASQKDILAAARGGGFLAGGSFFEFATRFVIAFLLARLLGAQDYGLYVLAISAGSLFAGISLLGLDDAMVRYVAILSGRRDRAGVLGTLQIGLGVSTLVGVLLGGAIFLGAVPVAEGFFEEPRLAPLLRLIAVLVPFLTISNVLAGVARGFKRMDYAAFAENVVQSLVRMVLLAVLALVGELNVFAAVVIFGIADVAATVTMIVLLNKTFPLGGSLRADTRRDVGEIFGFALPLWLSGLLRQFRRNIELVMLGALAAVSSVGIFAVVARVNLVGHVFLLSLLVAVKPILAQLHDRRDREGLSNLYRTATRWALTLTFPFFLIMVLYPKPLLLIFGEAFVSGSTALILLSFAELANAATGICGPMIDMTGHTRIKLANSVLWTAIVIVSSALLIPRWGVVGAAAASLIAIATVNVLCVVEVWVLEGLMPYDRKFLKPVAAGGAALIIGLVMKAWMPVATDLGVAFAQGALVSAAYAGFLLLLGLESEDRLVLGRAIVKVKRLIVGMRVVSRPGTGKVG